MLICIAFEYRHPLGHGGVEAAEFAKTNLFGFLPKTSEDLKANMRTAFLKTDEEFNKIANKNHLSSGSTAAVAIIQENQLVIG